MRTVQTGKWTAGSGVRAVADPEWTLRLEIWTVHFSSGASHFDTATVHSDSATVRTSSATVRKSVASVRSSGRTVRMSGGSGKGPPPRYATSGYTRLRPPFFAS